MQFVLAIFIIFFASYILWRRIAGSNSGAKKSPADMLAIDNFIPPPNKYQASKSFIINVENPLSAAAILLVSIQSEEFVLGDSDEEIITDLLCSLASQDEVEKAMEFAKVTAVSLSNRSMLIDKLGAYLKETLDGEEKYQLLVLFRKANEEIRGCFDFESRFDNLAKKMDFQMI